ncbi:T9SS type A sorting domain-containing protein [Hymenobacter sp. DH14]|uniref:T9SS type A sorting domain-containing protein n=1 Tax=Hymenobacter cyanobacteriorum TaxID=2926463 RepID=A0A9X1VFW3_9BACT|nr:T9SS type A sorting domain-containing protein [Hymenobacter cyanobacteriorum]MCI1188434.1 T9SS type A sorting domain-containing protein [Hymenobacter cyanobacteriorum]
MKRTFTLALAGALAATALTTHAQAITVDGTLSASEISSTGYQLIGRYNQRHSFGDAGLLAFYATADATNVYFFLAGTLETDGATATLGQIRNSLQIYAARPGVSAVPVGTALPMPALSNPITSFKLVSSKMELPGDFAIGVKGNGVAGQVQVDAVVYSAGNPATAITKNINATGANVTTGAPVTIGTAQATGQYALFANAVVAFRNSSLLSTNPGFASGGGAGSSGLEISMSRASLGLPSTGGALQLFGLQNNADGDFFSSDIIPQNTGAAPGADANGSLQHSPDFTAIPGRQVATLQVTATGGTVLGTRAADDAALGLRLYPNPANGPATLSYQAPTAAEVTVVLTDLLGRPVRVLDHGPKAAGSHLVNIDATGVAAGTYLVRVQVGEARSVQKLVLL